MSGPQLDIEGQRVESFDGRKLGLTVWGEEIDNPDHVVIGIHGMNDYANAFYMAAPYWAENGVRTYAYDQRGFGRSYGRGRWQDEEHMREDLRTMVALVRERHPEAVLSVVGISMGASLAMSTFGTTDAPKIDRLILSGPGLRGWGSIPLVQRVALFASAKIRPGWVVTPPRRFVKIEPSDNIKMLQERWADPLTERVNRIDQVYGVVQLMETAHKRARNLPDNTLFLYGAKDIVIPKTGVRRTTPFLPPHVRTIYYPDGYHMLMRDLQAETVWRDQLAFMQDPESELPSGLSELPWRQISE